MRDILLHTLRELGADRFRTLLSLTGVSTGVFSIVSALALVGSVERAVRESFESFGSDILFIEREPLEADLNEDGVFRWWEFVSRPMVSLKEYRYLRDNGEGACSSMAYAAYGENVTGLAGDWRLLIRQDLAQGRFFTQREIECGLPVAVVGAELEFEGSMIRIGGTIYRVAGVLKKAGSNAVSPVDVDNCCFVPASAMREPAIRSSILVAGADESRIRTLMRQVRRLQENEKDNFSFNRLSLLLDEMAEVFRLLSRLGWIVGLFSLMVGGFGVANVLYVSVEERKAQIGICRAIGAKKRAIVKEFLCEAAALSMLGGIGGISMASLAVLAVNLSSIAFPLYLDLNAISSGLAVSLVLGLVFGVAPARYAAGLDPIEAMRSV